MSEDSSEGKKDFSEVHIHNGDLPFPPFKRKQIARGKVFILSPGREMTDKRSTAEIEPEMGR